MNSSSNSRRDFLKKTTFGAVLAGSTNALPVEKSIETRLTKAYGISVPIVSAGMAFIASADLAIAVSKSGGLGQMSGSGFPVDYLKSQISKIKNAVGSKPYAVNFLPRFIQKEHIEVCISERVPVVVFFWDEVPASYMERLKANKIKVWFQVGSLKEAEKAAAQGADAIIVQGFEAGGHNRSTASALSLLPNIKKAFPNIHLILAGGIADGQGLAAALTLGADAVSVGTRFIASNESNAHPEYKKRIVAAEVHDTVRHNIFGYDFPDSTVRGIRNTIVAEFEGKDQPAPYTGKNPNDFPIIGQSSSGPIRRFSGVLPTPETTGDFEQMSLLAGESVGLIKDVKSVAEIISEMTQEALICLKNTNQMKKNLLLIPFLGLMLILAACTQRNISASKSAYKLHHIVLFNFKEGAPLDTIETAMYQLFGSIKGVNDLSFNKNVSSRNLDKGYKYSFYMTFESAFVRDSIFYPHVNYKKMGGVIGKHINEYLIYDYEIPAKSK